MPHLTIIHTEASDAWGGQDIRVLNEALWFQNQGHQVHLFSPAHGQIFQRSQRLGLNCEPIPFAKRTRVIDFFRLAQRFKKIRPDIVCTHSSIDSWLGLTAARHCKTPVSIRYRHVSTAVKNTLVNRWQYRSLCDHIVTTSRVIQKNISESFQLPPDKVSFVPTGIIPPRLPSRETAKAVLLKRYNLPDNALLIGQVAVLRSWKGQYVLIDAFERLAPQFPSSYLLLVGGGPVMGDYSKRSRESPHSHRILLPGHQEEIWPFFRGMDVAVLASTKNEGIPQAGLQAMFAGCPFIGTNVGGIPEIVRHEQTGLLVPPGNPQELAQAIMRILRQPEIGKTMAQQAQAEVQKSFTFHQMGQKLERLFTLLVSSASNRRR